MDLTNKNVLVTGADGFIGSHVVERLAHECGTVTAFTYYNSFGSIGWLIDIDPKIREKIKIISGDIRDANFVHKSLEGINVVFHLAALIAIPYSYHAPQSYVDTNVTGTLNVLLASKQHNLERVIVTSTSEVYGTAEYIPIDEEHPKKGQSPYSATKIAADALTESFFRSFNLPIIIARPFNTYGPRQSTRAIIPTIINQLINDKEEIKLGDLTPTRDLVYVKDTAEGFAKIASSDKLIGESCNIASSQEISMDELAKKLINIINPNARIVSDDIRKRPKKSEVFQLLGSASKLHEITGWKPQITLDEGLSETVEWFRNSGHLNQYDAADYII